MSVGVEEVTFSSLVATSWACASRDRAVLRMMLLCAQEDKKTEEEVGALAPRSSTH